MRVGLGATRAPCPWPVRTREEMQRTRTLIYRLLLLTYAKHIHIRTRRAQASHAQTDSLQVQRALSAYILVSQSMSVRSRIAERSREKIINGRNAFPSRELSLSGSSRCRSQPPSTRRVGSGKLRSRERARRVSTHARGLCAARGSRVNRSMALVPPKQLPLAIVPDPLSVRRCERFEGRRGAPCSSRLDGVGVGALGGGGHGLDVALLHERHEERAALLLLRQGRRARERGRSCGGALRRALRRGVLASLGRAAASGGRCGHGGGHGRVRGGPCG